MAGCCCTCPGRGGGGATKAAAPLICLVPSANAGSPFSPQGGSQKPRPASAPASGTDDNFQFLDADYIKKHFKLAPRAQYLDPFTRPLITYPTDQEQARHFSMHRKQKINQQILDGFLDPGEGISAPSVFPYAKSEAEKKEAGDDEEVIYILQLPDWEYQCPQHGEIVRTPRFIWHSCKKSKEKEQTPKQGGGPLNRPKPWLLSRHTDFDLLSQW